MSANQKRIFARNDSRSGLFDGAEFFVEPTTPEILTSRCEAGDFRGGLV